MLLLCDCAKRIEIQGNDVLLDGGGRQAETALFGCADESTTGYLLFCGGSGGNGGKLKARQIAT